MPASGEAAEELNGGNDEAEAVARRALPSPYMPTVSEIREHKTTHLPYRNWCDECVEAFAREWPHLARDGPSDRSTPVIHIDYACLTEKGLFKPCEFSEEVSAARRDAAAGGVRHRDGRTPRHRGNERTHTQLGYK